MPLNEEILNQCPNEVFVETGTNTGDGIRLALKAGFAEIHSIEVSGPLYEFARKKFYYYDNVRLHQGDSSRALEYVIRGIDKRITFWLDAHANNLNAIADYNKTPMLEELEAISKHPVKNHTIIIDDVDDFGQYGTGLEEVTNILKAINEDYQTETYKTQRTVLIAKVPLGQ